MALRGKMQSFEDQFLIPGLQKIDKIVVNTATPTEEIIQNIKTNIKRDMIALHQTSDWRDMVPFAVVGGGPSLKTELDKLRKFKYIMAAGSSHDYLMSEGIIPTWTVVCDPDPIMQSYLSKVDPKTKFLLASQCHPTLFEYFNSKNADTTIWHLYGDKFDNNIYGEGQLAVGGGCTVGTRSMCIAMGMGFYNLHLFGMDTCLDGEVHHAYDFNDPTVEKIYDSYDIKFEAEGPTFKVAGYHLGQLFDIKGLMAQYANKMHMTVHGKSLLSYYMELALKRLELYNKQQLETKNG